VAIGFQRGLARHLGVEPARVSLDHVGLNHLSWIRRSGRGVPPARAARGGGER
jgi:6-phospho-beta-glucosidase